jgi:DnaJ-class molecular chaperone
VIAVERAYELFGITREQFMRMSRKELTRLYRREAKKMHPDRGGSHEDFLELSEAYEKLLGMQSS